MERVKQSKILRVDTEEDMQNLIESAEDSIKNGRYITLEEACQHWKERYGIEIIPK